MRCRAIRIVVLAVVGALACRAVGETARDRINAGIPRADDLQQRWQAIQISMRSLAELEPNALCRVSATAVEPRLARFVEEQLAAAEKPPGVRVTASETRVDFQKQWIALSARLDVEIEELTLKLRVRVGGGAAPVLLGRELRMFVALTDVEVETVEMPDPSRLEGMLPVINNSLRITVAQINDTFEQRAFIVPIDLAPIGPIDARQLSAIDGLADVTAAPIVVAYALRGAAVLIDGGGMSLLAEITFADAPEMRPVAEPAAPPDLTEELLSESYARLEERFARSRATFADPPPNDVAASVAVSRALAAEAINKALAAPRFCGSYDLAGVSTSFDQQINTFQNGTIDCSPRLACDLVHDTRDCRRARVCERRHDDRDCRRWFGNDPLCEAAKAAQNLAYEAEFAACQLTPQFLVDAQCEVDKAAANAAHKINHDLCEVDKARLKGQCELYKELVKQAQQIASVSGSLDFGGKARLCIDRIQAPPDLSSVDVSVTVAAEAIGVTGWMRYVPQNIPGHLGCPGEWRRDVGASVQVPAQSLTVTMPLTFVQNGERTLITYEVGEQTLGAAMHPPPFEAVFARHPDLVVVCPGPAAVLGTASILNAAYFATRGEDLAPELRGKLNLTTRRIRQAIAIEPKETVIGDARYTLVPRIGERAIEFVARTAD